MDNKVVIYGRSGSELLKIEVDDSSYRYRAIMSTNSVTLYYSLDEHVEIPVGAYIIYQGARYTLWNPENFKKNSTRNFEYTVEFGSNAELLKIYKYKDLSEVPYRVKFPLTAKPITFLRLLVNNLNLRDSGWKVGTCIDASEKALSFNHEYCYDVLGRLASEWGTEWEIEDKTINLCKVEKFKSSPMPLSYGKGKGIKPGTGRANQEDKKPVSLLYVQGGERNIDYSKYKSKSLLLPISQELVYEGRHYVTDEHGMYIVCASRVTDIIVEDSYDASDIYPKRVGTITAVDVVDEGKNFYDFADSSIPDDLNYENCLIAGETMTVIFQSGMLAGREFEVKYIHEPIEDKDKQIEKAGRRFEIVPQELDGIMMPDKVYCPKAGDTYAVFNVSLPDAYICNNSDKTGASWDMFRDAVRYFYEHEEVEFTFSGTLDGIWAKKKWLEIGGRIVPGGYIRFSDTQFQPDGIDIRITGVKDYINKPYSPEIELSNTPVAGYVASDLGKIDADEVINEGFHKDALQFTKRRWRDAMETFGMLEDAFLNFSNSIDPIAVRTMQLLVGDESLQFRFVTSKANPVVIAYNITYDTKEKVLKAPATILQHMTMGISSIASTHKSEEYKFWDMAEYNSPKLIDPAKKYYMYAKVSKNNSSGTFLLSETAIKLEGVSGYYHLLVGVLNSECEGERSFVELYGFTEILPGRITTELIISSDGKTYFSLARGEIGGNIKIKAGSSGMHNFEEWEALNSLIDEIEKSASDANDAVSGLNTYVDGAFADGIITEAEAKAIEKYINTVNNVKAAVEATYNKLYVNTYLTGAAKTGLLNAKVTLMGSIENLIKSINTAIADGQTTVAEKKDVDDKYALFNTAMAAFNTAVETANKAIQDNLKGYTDDCYSELDVLGDRITAQVKRIDEISGTIDSSGWITTADGNRLYASKSLENGDNIISYINQSAGETTISSAKINLLGAITINALDSSLQGKINSMITNADLGKLAFQDAVEAAQLGSTIIVGGYLNTDLIKVRRIDANSGFIGGFTLDNGTLYWKGYDYFGGDSRSVRLGVPTNSKSGMVDVSFNGATEGRFGVKVVGSNSGGACVYASRYSTENERSYPNSNNTYAGFFDGGVFVKGSLLCDTFFANEFGTSWSINGDGSYSYRKGVTQDISQQYGPTWHFVNGLFMGF